MKRALFVICCGSVVLALQGPVRAGVECMESPGCPERVQRCYDGICTSRRSCDIVHRNPRASCKCRRDIGPWTRRAQKNCGQRQARKHECMESPGCPQGVQRCHDGICTPRATCDIVHRNPRASCKCRRDIGPWTRRAQRNCTRAYPVQHGSRRSLYDQYKGTYHGRVSTKVNNRPGHSQVVTVTCRFASERDTRGRAYLRCSGVGTTTLFAVDDNGRIDANHRTTWGYYRTTCTGNVSFNGAHLKARQTCTRRNETVVRTLDLTKR